MSEPKDKAEYGEDVVVLPVMVFKKHGTAQNYISELERQLAELKNALPADLMPSIRRQADIERENAELRQQLAASAGKTAATVQPVEKSTADHSLDSALLQMKGMYSLMMEFKVPPARAANTAAHIESAIRHLHRLASAAAPQPQAAQSEDSRDAVRLPPFNADVAEILGRLCFQCIRIAELLRAGGQKIDSRAEAEQAAVIYWMLDLYAKHGASWSAKGDEILRGFAALAQSSEGKKP
jgi:hypothetical protein